MLHSQLLNLAPGPDIPDAWGAFGTGWGGAPHPGTGGGASGGGAGYSGDGAAPLKEAGRVRSDFAETWLWAGVHSGYATFLGSIVFYYKRNLLLLEAS